VKREECRVQSVELGKKEATREKDDEAKHY
jgi:hypothetical protein